MSRHFASELAIRLGQQAEAVCRHYLSNGRRVGRYWQVGDARNTPGRSMFVRLSGPQTGRGAAGHWTDAASNEFGDLLDVIRESCGLSDFKEVLDEARSFLLEPHPIPESRNNSGQRSAVVAGTQEAARRLIAMTQPIKGTLAETYLRNRAITCFDGTAALRYHPHCYYRADVETPMVTWPAMIAVVTDLSGTVTGAHRTWLDPEGFSEAHLGRAPIETSRRAMGHLLGNAVRFGLVSDVMAVGEGIETVLSIRSVLPTLPVQAALSAAHLSAILFPPTLRRLYIVRDRDPAGDRAMMRLMERAGDAGIETVVLTPQFEDFNEDLRLLGYDALAARLRDQIVAQDRSRFRLLAP